MLALIFGAWYLYNNQLSMKDSMEQHSKQDNQTLDETVEYLCYLEFYIQQVIKDSMTRLYSFYNNHVTNYVNLFSDLILTNEHS